jgi:hypothetical protein
LVLISSKRDLSTCIFYLITVFLILSFLEIRAERRQESISVEFSFATVLAFKHHVSAAYLGFISVINNFHMSAVWGFLRAANDIFVLLGCYLAYIGSYGRFETTYPSRLYRSRSPRRSTAWRVGKGPIFCSETSLTTNLCCVTPQKIADIGSPLFYVACQPKLKNIRCLEKCIQMGQSKKSNLKS